MKQISVIARPESNGVCYCCYVYQHSVNESLSQGLPSKIIQAFAKMNMFVTQLCTYS